MKILLDENIHIGFASKLTGHEVYTVSQMGWASKKNGELMSLTSENGFDCFLTLDRNIKYQQNLEKYKFKVIVLFVVNSRIETSKSSCLLSLTALEKAQMENTSK